MDRDRLRDFFQRFFAGVSTVWCTDFYFGVGQERQDWLGLARIGKDWLGLVRIG